MGAGNIHKGGRHPKYNNCIDFDGKCEMYFEECDARDPKRPYLKSGLALYLGVCTETMRLYSKNKKSMFFAIIKRCYDRIQNDLEERAIIYREQAVGCLFNLKANHGMSETQNINTNLVAQHNLNDVSEEEIDQRITKLLEQIKEEESGK